MHRSDREFERRVARLSRTSRSARARRTRTRERHRPTCCAPTRQTTMGLGYTTPPHRRAHLDRSRVTGSTEQLIEQLRGARFDADEAHTRSIFSFRLFQAIAHSSLELDLEIFAAHRQGNRDPAIL